MTPIQQIQRDLRLVDLKLNFILNMVRADIEFQEDVHQPASKKTIGLKSSFAHQAETLNLLKKQEKL